VLTLSLDGQKPDFRNRNSPSVPVSGVPLFHASSAPLVTLELTSSIASPRPSERQLTPSLSQHPESITRMMLSSAAAQLPTTTSSSTPTPSSTQSMKPPGGTSNATAGLGGRPWDVKFHRDVAKTVAKNGGENSPTFTPTVRDFKTALASNPKQFPKKSGKLKDARATHLRFADGVEWVAVYSIDEKNRVVRVLSLGPHDRAYEDAEKRI
jgi:hypothetical protein